MELFYHWTGQDLDIQKNGLPGTEPNDTGDRKTVSLTRTVAGDGPRIAIVSLGVPPSPYGQSRALGQLLNGEAPDRCLLISERPPDLRPEAGDKPYGSYRKLVEPWFALWPEARFAHLPSINKYGGFLFSAWRRAREIAHELKAFRAEVVVTCTASPFDIPATALAALMTRTPLAVYMFDDPIFQWEPGPLRRFASLWEPLWSRLAAATIAPNEFMARDFERRTGKRPAIVRNPVSDAVFDKGSSIGQTATESDRTSIVYTGTVYHAQADAFGNLLQALDRLDGRFVLDIYTSQTEAQVAEHGVGGRHVLVHEYLDQEASYVAQRGAGILFLPLAFRSQIQEVLRSSAPAKLGEYLASGRPLLVHAPADTFIVDHIRRHRAGIIVDTPDPAALVAALQRMVSHPDEVAPLVQNAAGLAELYRASAARQAFWTLIERLAAGEIPR